MAPILIVSKTCGLILKQNWKSIRGSQHAMLDGHLDEFVYRYNRKAEGPIFELLLSDISMFYLI